MKIAITGGSGGIGSAITELALAQGHQVLSIDRVPPTPEATHAEVAYAQLDLTDYDAFEQALRGCDALVHMAAIPAPGHHPDHVVHNNNVVSSYNALRAAAELGITRVCQASSVNAIGHSYSRAPRYDYFPLDEQHPTYNEDPYSLSKWICEQQADSFARRYAGMTIASMRFHWVVHERAVVVDFYPRLGAVEPRHLWAYTRRDAAARACLLALTADFQGHEVFFIVAPDTGSDEPSLALHGRYYPHVELRGAMRGRASFFSSSKAERMLGWRHEVE